MRVRHVGLKVTAFVVAMLLVAAGLIFVFGQFRSGSDATYHATFTDASRLKAGTKVRMSGINVGEVGSVALNSDNTVDVSFGVDERYPLFSTTRATIRYENLVGDRYLAVETPAGPARVLPHGSTIALDNTAPALDFDALLGGLRPVVKGLDARKVNELTGSIIQLLQGQGGALAELLAHTSSFSQALVSRRETVGSLITNLATTLAVIDRQGKQLDDSLSQARQLVTELAANRDPIAGALPPLAGATNDLTETLQTSRRPLQGILENTRPLMTEFDTRKADVNKVVENLPEDYLRVTSLGAYGSFFNIFFCELRLKINGPAGSDILIPFSSPIDPTKGRCSEHA